MTEYAYDGTPLQEGLGSKAVHLTNNSPYFSIHGLREMTIVQTRYVDMPGNSSRSFVEYTCRDLGSGELIPHCRQLTAVGSLDGGDDNVLHAASKLVPNAKAKDFNDQTHAASTDGDRVLVGFIEGSMRRPVILGVLTHPSSKYGANKAAGERRLTLHKGTSVEIKSDGEYVITHKEGAVVTLLTSGDVQVRPAAGKDVFIGDQGATENLVLGQALKTFLEQVIDILTTATYPTGVGPSGPMLPPGSPQLIALKAQIEVLLLSTMAFTQKEQT